MEASASFCPGALQHHAGLLLEPPMKRFAICLMSLIWSSSWADGACTPNALQVDVCRAAADISESISQELPLRLNKNLVLQHIAALGNVIKMRAVFDYTEAQLIEATQQGSSVDAMKAAVRDGAAALVCRPDTELSAFIDLGGELQFLYVFSDGAHFLTVNVDHCVSERAR